MFHSLGGYHAGAFAAALAADLTPAFSIVGAVAIDAMSPYWSAWDTPIPEASCSPDHALESGDSAIPFWRMVRDAEPTGLVRILYVSGYGGYDEVVKWFPPSVQSAMLANAMRPKYPRTILLERARWSINCGFARPGVGIFASVTRMELITATGGLNNTHWADAGPAGGATVTHVISDCGHQDILLKDGTATCEGAPRIAAMLVRVINAVH